MTRKKTEKNDEEMTKKNITVVVDMLWTTLKKLRKKL